MTKLDGYEIRVQSWSGNVRNWAASVYCPDGSFLRRSGFCRSEFAAEQAGRRIVAKDYRSRFGTYPNNQVTEVSK